MPSYLRRWFVLVLLAAWCPGCQVPPGNSSTGDFSPETVDGDLPLTLDFSIKNSRGDSLIIHYFYGKVFVTEQVGTHPSTYNLVPTAQDWAEFWRAAEGVHIWDWVHSVDPREPSYWSLELSHRVQKVSVAGSYDERAASPMEGGWPALVAALERLIHHEPAILRESLKGA